MGCPTILIVVAGNKISEPNPGGLSDSLIMHVSNSGEILPILKRGSTAELFESITSLPQ